MRTINHKRLLLSQISGLVGFLLPLSATAIETITIGKGSGIVWEGMPFNETLRGPMQTEHHYENDGMAAISDSTHMGCIWTSNLRSIGGYLAFPLRDQKGVETGVGLVPRAQAYARYTLYDGSTESLNGTIGLPETRGSTSSGFESFPPGGRSWCLQPRPDAFIRHFYNSTTPRTVNISGSWVMVSDGSQTSQILNSGYLYAVSHGFEMDSELYESIMPVGVKVRISALECTVNTPTVINFGMVTRNTVVNSELAGMTVPLVVSCGQPSDYINANINVQFRAASGLYNSTPSRLALNQGGGFITGEIDGGITGSGQCASSSGLSFDGQPIKLGEITSQDEQKVFNHQLTWRLCSGGASLPTGKVSATTEMLVTFN